MILQFEPMIHSTDGAGIMSIICPTLALLFVIVLFFKLLSSPKESNDESEEDG